MCTVGGPVDIDLPPDRVKGKDYRCKECGERFKGIGKKPICPSLSVRRRERSMNYPLNDEIALVRGRHSFLLVAKANSRFPLCIETPTEEVCQGIDPTDLIVVSALREAISNPLSCS